MANILYSISAILHTTATIPFNAGKFIRASAIVFTFYTHSQNTGSLYTLTFTPLACIGRDVQMTKIE